MTEHITMMQFRKSPGWYVYWKVRAGHESFILTHSGKPVAKLVPLDFGEGESTKILSNGTCIGPKPLMKGLGL